MPVVGGNVSLYNESRGTRHRPDAGRRACSASSTGSQRRPPGVRLVDGHRIARARRGRARRPGRITAGRRPRRRPGRHAAAGRPRRRRPRSAPSCASSSPTASCPAPTTSPKAGSARPWPRWRWRRASGSNRPGARRWPTCSASRRAGSSCASRPTTSPTSSAAPRPPACRRRRLGLAGGDRLVVKDLLEIRPRPTPSRPGATALPCALGHGTAQEPTLQGNPRRRRSAAPSIALRV